MLFTTVTLAVVCAAMALMDRGAARIDPGQAWRRVSAQSARMTGLVEDLLLLARLDEGRPLEAVEVNLATLVAEAVRDARAAGGDHDWQLALRLDEPATVTGDPARLTQVVANLLANARARTPPGTRITVTVEATRAPAARGGRRCRVIRVRDDGPGLLPTVFERFTRADTSRTRTPGEGGGSGRPPTSTSASTAPSSGPRSTARRPAPWPAPTGPPRAAPPPRNTSTRSSAPPTATATARNSSGSTT